MKTSLVQFLILIIAGTVVTGASAAESANSIDIGLGGLNPLPHCNVYVSMIDYEHQITPTTTFQVQGSLIHYKYDDGHYLDEGRLKGMDGTIQPVGWGDSFGAEPSDTGMRIGHSPNTKTHRTNGRGKETTTLSG